MYNRFEELLKEKKVRVADVSRATGIRSGVFTDWKAGRYVPKYDKLKKIADYFGVSIEYLTQTENSPIVHADGQSPVYYTNEETAKVAQKVFDDPNYRILFDAASDAKPEDILMAAEMLRRFKEARGE